MDINKLIKEAHEAAVDKGFYDCEWCDGRGFWDKPLPESQIELDAKCDKCNATGIDQNKNIPELLMLIITEISEAVEALRKGKHIFDNDFYKDVDIFEFIKHRNIKQQNKLFEINIKDTFEDEIADVFIRLADHCGHLGVDIEENIEADKFLKNDNYENKIEFFFYLSKSILDLYQFTRYNDDNYSLIYQVGSVFIKLEYFCEVNKIDIEKHIKAKLEYNKSRPKKHGKEF